jgi:hypothetical protein
LSDEESASKQFVTAIVRYCSINELVQWQLCGFRGVEDGLGRVLDATFCELDDKPRRDLRRNWRGDGGKDSARGP